MNKSEVISKSICFPNKQHRYRLFLMCSVDHLHLRARDSASCDLLFIISGEKVTAQRLLASALPLRATSMTRQSRKFMFFIFLPYPTRNLNEMTQSSEQSVSAAAHLSIQVTAISPQATLVYLLHNLFMNRWLRLPRSGILCFVTTERGLPVNCSKDVDL